MVQVLLCALWRFRLQRVEPDTFFLSWFKVFAGGNHSFLNAVAVWISRVASETVLSLRMSQFEGGYLNFLVDVVSRVHWK